jgi:putative endonuclease
MREHNYFVYMLSSLSGVLYVGVTNDLERRLWEHRQGGADGFTDRYLVHRLVWFENTGQVDAAIAREKQIKNWRREKKVALIESVNPQWRDLSEDWS